MPGWTLPGVITAGAVQALLKSAALVPSGRVVLAGAGPLLWQVAWQCCNAGAASSVVLETIPRGRLAEAMRHAPGSCSPATSPAAWSWCARCAAARGVVEHVRRCAHEGDGRVQRIAWQANGSWSEVDVDALVLSHGVVPNIHLPAALGAELAWNADKSAFQPVVDAWGGTSVAGLRWPATPRASPAPRPREARGRLAALAVANALGRIDAAQRDAEAEPPCRRTTHALRGRRFLDVLYRAGRRLPSARTARRWSAAARRSPRAKCATRCAPVRAVDGSRSPRAAAWGPARAASVC